MDWVEALIVLAAFVAYAVMFVMANRIRSDQAELFDEARQVKAMVSSLRPPYAKQPTDADSRLNDASAYLDLTGTGLAITYSPMALAGERILLRAGVSPDIAQGKGLPGAVYAEMLALSEWNQQRPYGGKRVPGHGRIADDDPSMMEEARQMGERMLRMAGRIPDDVGSGAFEQVPTDVEGAVDIAAALAFFMRELELEAERQDDGTTVPMAVRRAHTAFEAITRQGGRVVFVIRGDGEDG